MPLRPPPYVRAALFAALTALLGVLLPAPPAWAAARAVQGGRLDWGVKSSFLSYVTGPVAQGSYALTGGAATVGAGGFRFHSATGSYDAATGAFNASFAGGVRFTGHRRADGAYELDMTLGGPSVRIAGGRGTLFLDVTAKARGSGKVTTSRQVPFATLSLGGVDMRGGGSAVTLNNLPTRLTSEGAAAFAGYYPAGTPLDPVSLSADVAPASAAGPAEGTLRPTPGASADRAGEPTPAGGPVRDGAVDWGVRRTFREYVTGPIAAGGWTTAAGARDGGALFRFPLGKGTYDARTGTLRAEFTGSVRFTGRHGLDLTLARPAVRIERGTGILAADITGSGGTRAGVPLVTFEARAPKTGGGLVAVEEAPSRLTAEGAAAFGSLYPAGTAMDPVSVAVALTDGARLPALPDLGSGTDATSAPPRPERTTAAAATAADSASGAAGSALPLGTAAAVLLLGTGVGYALLRRRRTPRAAPAGTPDTDPAADPTPTPANDTASAPAQASASAPAPAQADPN